MSKAKQVVEQYMQGFRESDHEKVLECLTEDVIWHMPGYFHLQGKEDFDKEIENDLFTGSPSIQVFRMTEEATVVIAEGAVQGRFKTGDILDAVFCDVFEFEGLKIKKLISYQMNK